MEFRFTLPRDIYVGHGAIKNLAHFKGCKRAFVTTGGHSMRRGGFLQKVEQVLKDNGMEVKILEGIQPDPSVESVYEGAAMMCEFNPDLIVSIGGGSPIDATKAMWIFYEHPELKFEDVLEPFSIPALRTKARFVAISSTSGTATEVTSFSVITDYSKGIKYPLADFNITPDMAILDLDIPQTMPPKLVAHTGMDALTHAIESYICKGAWELSDTLSLKSIQMISDNLRASVNENSMEAKNNMGVAQYVAGMSFSNVGLGIVHSMAHPLGAFYDTPHGVANAVLLPYVMEYNAPATGEKYRDIAQAMGVDTTGMSQEEYRKAAVDAVRALSKDVGIPEKLHEIGVKEEDLHALSESAFADVCTGGNPRDTSVEEICEIYKKAF